MTPAGSRRNTWIKQKTRASSAEIPRTGLVVDDQIQMRKAIKRILEGETAYTLHVVDSLAGAREFLRHHPVDFVLCDLYLPDGFGMDLLRHVRSRALGHDIPFVLVTGEGTKEEIVRAADEGVSEYLLKPFEPGELVTKLLTVLDLYDNPSPVLTDIRAAEGALLGGNLEAALARLNQISPRERAHRSRYLVARAGCCLASMDYTGCRRLLQEAEQENPNYFPIYSTWAALAAREGNVAEELAMRESELRIHPKQPERRVELASLYCQGEEWDSAVSHLRSALLAEPSCEAAMLLMGRIHLAQRQAEKAIQCALKARRRVKGSEKALELLSEACLALNKPERALQLFADLARQSPNDAGPLLAKAQHLARIDRMAQAEAEVRLALELAPGHPKALPFLGELLLRKAQSSGKEEDYRSVVQGFPTEANWEHMAVFYLRRNRFQSALGAYDQALSLEPDAARNLYNAGYCWERLGNLHKALVFYTKALTQQPNLEEANKAIERVNRLLLSQPAS